MIAITYTKVSKIKVAELGTPKNIFRKKKEKNNNLLILLPVVLSVSHCYSL
jgi:hypothetical protein